MQCSYPCRYTSYKLRYGTWDLGDVPGVREKSIQIGFSSFMIKTYKEYHACDVYCVLGELGGNLGFFLGGSILAAIDFIIYLSTKFVSSVAEKTKERLQN